MTPEDLLPDKKVILRFLELEKEGYSDLRWPDMSRSADACCEVDAVFTYKGERFALEHTKAVCFEGEYRSIQQFNDIKGELESRAFVPPFPVDVFLPFRDYGNKKNRSRIIESIESGLPNALGEMGNENSIDLPVDGVKWQVWICRRKCGESNEIRFKQFNPPGSDQYIKLKEQLEKKLTKLMPYGKQGYKTLLLLEIRVGYSLVYEVADSFLGYERQNNQLLDELYEVRPKNSRGEMEFSLYDLDSFRKRHVI
jgi:hypothetical protein